MKKYISFLLIFALSISLFLCACSSYNDSEESTTEDSSLIQARESVINKWEYERDCESTPEYIKKIYNQFPNDPEISNIYFCCTAIEEYNKYNANDKQTLHYLESAAKYAKEIDPTYAKSFCKTILYHRENIIQEYNHIFHAENYSVNNTNNVTEPSTNQYESEKYNKPYSQLTDADKREINNFIKDRYKYYDLMNGHNTGDQYSNKIWHETMEEYGLTSDQVDQIWINGYKY